LSKPSRAPFSIRSGERRAARVLLEPAGFVALLALYLGIHVLLRLTLSQTLTSDDARDAFFAQTLEWGYLPKQPPLYNWLVLGAFQVLGVSVVSMTLVKYLVLALVYGFVYLSGRRLVSDARLAALAAFSLLLMVPVNWVVHEILTHSVAAMAAAPGTFYALLRLEASPSRGAYLALGLALALGMLSKFSYLFFAAALLLAALTVPSFRGRLLDRRILLTLGIAIVLVSPYLTWVSARRLSLVGMYAEEVGPEVAASYLRGVARGFYYLARVTFYHLTPLWLVLLLIFPKAWTARGSVASAPPGCRLLERFLLVELGLLVGGVLVGAVTYLKFRWVMPFYLLVPLYAFARIDRLGVVELPIRRFGRALLVAEAAIVVAIVISICRGDFFGKPSQFNVPYDWIADEIAAAGFSRGTIVAGGGALAGNLRLRFPDSRVIRLTNPDYVPPSRPPLHNKGQCLLVWELGPPDTVQAKLREWATATLGVGWNGQEPVHTIDVPYRFSKHYTFRVAYVLLADGSARCR
jgi:4-amino-4-deoxy-L-arabinose transferase-like glycosyltransferase